MALRGNLRDFSLPDVFQLVTFSKKTGVLRIARGDGATGAVWFRDGDVFFASSNWHKEPLGERLVKAQRITGQALKRGLDLRSAEPADGRRLGQILVDEGYITESVLEGFVSEQIQDTIFDLMRWDEGDFDFEAMPELVDEDIGLSVSIENVVMEGSRRLEEWNRIKKKIPSVDVVFKMATAPGEGTFEISLKPIEWQLLLLTDATRSVADLAVETGRTDFDVARIIYGLFSAGLLEFATDEEIERNRADRKAREQKLAEAKAAEAARAPAPPAVAQPVQQAVQEPEPGEVPQFLGGGVSQAPDDAAVLEQAMGALLNRPSAPPTEVPTPAEPEPPKAAPHVAAEEPAFMSAPGTAAEEEVLPVSSLEDLLGMEAVRPVPAPVLPEEEPQAPVEEAIEEQGVTPTPPAEAELVVESSFFAPPIEEPAAAAPAIEEATEEATQEEPQAAAPSGMDFERDLMALGLGELPSDLLQPMSYEPQQVETPEAGEPFEEEPLEAVAEPMSELGTSDFGFDELGLTDELTYTQAPPIEIEETAGEPDFSALLQSLDVDAELEADETRRVTPVESGFDAELLEDESVARPAGGVISTDAFLEDITIDDLGFTGGLTDELSALTGAARRQPTRPQAKVKSLPAEGSPVIQRDARVDKDTVMKIIDGIKKL